MSVSQNIEFQYSTGDGQVWMIRCDREKPMDAVDAVFRWFRDMDEFGSQHVGVFLTVILDDAMARGRLTRDGQGIVQRMFLAVPTLGISDAAKLNLMREIMRSALDSSV